MVDALFKFQKNFEDMAWIIQIGKSVEADGLEKKKIEWHLIIKWFEPNYVLRQRMQEVWDIRVIL
jgi:hypothetical protein